MAAIIWIGQTSPSLPAVQVSAGQWAVVTKPAGMVAHVDPSEQDEATAFVGHGERVFVVEGAISAGDSTWVPVQLGDPDQPAFGWILQGRGLTPLQPTSPPPCPREPNVLSVVYLAPAERLVCFGAQNVTFQAGQFQAAPGNPGLAGDPGWLGGPLSLRVWGELGIDSPGGSLSVATPPGLTIPVGAGWYRIQGHFDDPASAGCSVSIAGRMLPATQSALWCREQFVVTAVLPTGAPRPSRDVGPPAPGQGN